MIKSISVILGGLFLVSTTYYLAFWERFDVDVFQYIQISDIIKGAVYPMRIVGLWYLCIIFLVLISISLAASDPVNNQKANKELKKEAADTKEENQHNFLYNAGRLLLLVIIMLSIIFYFYTLAKGLRDVTIYVIQIAGFSAAYAFISFYTYKRLYIDTDKQKRIIISLKSIAIFGIKLANVSKYEQREEKETESRYDTITDYLSIPTFAYLMVCSIYLGRLDSEKVAKCVEYNYVKNLTVKAEVRDTIFSKLIYLGAISDKLIFLNKVGVNQSHIIINKDKVPFLEVYHYNLNEQVKNMKLLENTSINCE